MRSFRRVVEGPVAVEAVFDLIASEKWPEVLAEHLGDDSRLVSREVGADGSVTLVMTRKLPSGVPGFLEKFLPSEPRVITTDVWGPPVDGRRACEWTADIVGTPAKLSGTQLLEPTDTGNRHVVDGSAKVPVPLVGGKAESFIAEQCARMADLEAAVVRELLGE